MGDKKGIRLAKFIAHSGVCSRREAEKLIEEDYVKVNDKVINHPAFHVQDNDQVSVKGKMIQRIQDIRLWMYYKPIGVMCSSSDQHGQYLLTDVLKNQHPNLPRVISVGRLDINSEGLLLLTNYGPLARYFELPQNHFKRVYKVRIFGNIHMENLEKLSQGITIDGMQYGSIYVTMMRQSGKNAWIQVKLSEGKNREIRNVMAHLGYQVNRLVRLEFGPYNIAGLKTGDLREVSIKKTLLDQIK